jgi:hypothetical protein
MKTRDKRELTEPLTWEDIADLERTIGELSADMQPGDEAAIEDLRLQLSVLRQNLTYAEKYNQEAATGMTDVIERMRPLKKTLRRGAKVAQGASEGGTVHAAMAKARHAQWQARADEILGKHPTYSRWRVAGIIHDEQTADTEFPRSRRQVYSKLDDPE